MPNLIATKPVAAVGTLTAAGEGVAAWLVSRHDIPAGLAPWVAFAVAALALTLIHELVSPYRKVRDVLERAGVLSDADVARIEAMIAERTGIDLADDVTVEHPTSDIPDGMAAGGPVTPA